MIMALSTLRIRNQKAAHMRRTYQETRAFVDELLIDARAERALARRTRVIRLAATAITIALVCAFVVLTVLRLSVLL